MTKQELLQAVQDLPDCYEIDGPNGNPIVFRVDREKQKIIIGVMSSYNSSIFVPLEIGRPCRYDDECCHYDPIR
jgi:hypothetical protein